MIRLSYIKRKIKDVNAEDIFQFFPMFIGGILSPFYKKRYRNLWIISDEKLDAVPRQL